MDLFLAINWLATADQGNFTLESSSLHFTYLPQESHTI